MNQVVCIHPYDKSTLFLKKIIESLATILNDKLIVYSISPDDMSHEACLSAIEDLEPNTTIIFLGHGGSDYLLGAAGDFANSLIDERAIDDESHLYSHGHFINRNNVNVFADKKIFCLSCNSGEELATLAIEQSANVFIGFKDIPTDVGEFKKLGYSVDELTVGIFIKHLNEIVINSMLTAIKDNLNYNEIKSILRLWTNIQSFNLILENKGDANRRIVSDALYHFKNGIKVFGNGEIRFND